LHFNYYLTQFFKDIEIIYKDIETNESIYGLQGK